MSKRINLNDINLINTCFKEMQRFDNFLPITYEKIISNKFLLEECLCCVDDMYHKYGINDMNKPNKFGLELYRLEEKLNRQIYWIEILNDDI